jgi:hypothetical protein
VVAFQLHRYTRTRDLWEEFTSAFNDADLLLMTEIYAAGEAKVPGVEAATLVEEIRAHGHRDVQFVPDLDAVLERLVAEVLPGDLVVTLGAGSIATLGARLVRDAMEEALGDGVRFGVPLSHYTSLRVGGPADALATPGDRGDLASLLGICAAHRIPHAVLGGGFNTLALDGGAEGVVIQMGRMRRLEERPGGRLRAEAGVSHAQLTGFCCSLGLAGLEFASGIPGSVGGWVAMNAGVPGREMKGVVREVEVMSPSGRTVRHIDRDRLDFRYRRLRGLAPGSVSAPRPNPWTCPPAARSSRTRRVRSRAA